MTHENAIRCPCCNDYLIETDDGPEAPEQAGFEDWDWCGERPVEPIAKNSVGSGYDVGVDVHGQVVIRHNGYVKTVGHGDLIDALEKSSASI